MQTATHALVNRGGVLKQQLKTVFVFFLICNESYWRCWFDKSTYSHEFKQPLLLLHWNPVGIVSTIVASNCETKSRWRHPLSAKNVQNVKKNIMGNPVQNADKIALCKKINKANVKRCFMSPNCGFKDIPAGTPAPKSVPIKSLIHPGNITQWFLVQEGSD